MHIYIIYVFAYIFILPQSGIMWFHATLTRNQTYSLDHSWCNFSIKSFIIQQFSFAQHQPPPTRTLTLLFVQSSSRLLPLSPFFSHRLHIVSPLDVNAETLFLSASEDNSVLLAWRE